MDFELLPPLPISFPNVQYVTHNHEILICGGFQNNKCYSYHTLKNQLKHICDYPAYISLRGHCVVKRVDNSNPNYITLLSFGGFYNHVLVMKYASVWSDDEKISETEKEDCNKWFPLKNNKDKSILKKRNEYEGVRAVLGGSNNHLLFITCQNNIYVLDLDTFQYIKRDFLPSAYGSDLSFHCFVARSDSDANTGKKTNKMILFSGETGLSIEYNEDSNTLHYHKLQICEIIPYFKTYCYLSDYDVILFFGEPSGYTDQKNEVYKYSIMEDKWMKFEHMLPIKFVDYVAIFDEDNAYVHILSIPSMQIHMKVNAKEWMKEETESERKWIWEEKERKKIKAINKEIEAMQEFDLKKLKVIFKLNN
ncbi:hypothetical protein RFI_10996 [Reticulomyxa filosa]|uniref:Kelch motif family protein n=1 Tax=Reticulomyxa filosa TaxID=46433 RepID=X6NJP9_RETFI|nr:hypothetical protein RFI_10996 [Reticulomyxa filosa]|eukprot:ETO26143.1 hypothetical protein RFI_10996 [Reticulomyxa filosa]